MDNIALPRNAEETEVIEIKLLNFTDQPVTS